ncbi:MAG: cytochrome P450 [Haloferacaceae archaeon]
MRQRRRPPGPRGEPLFGNVRKYADDPFDFLDAVSDAYGDVVGFDLGPYETVLVTHPDQIERVLVAEDAKYHKPDFQDDALGQLLGNGLLLSEGETWRKQRNLVGPAFAPDRVVSLAETMAGHAESMVGSWAAGDVVDVEAEMARVTVKIIADAMFGVEFDAERVRRVQENLDPLGSRFEPNPFRFLVPDWAPTRENREYDAALAELDAVLDDVLEERRGTEGGDGDDPPTDMLSLLLRAERRGDQTEAQIRDEMMTMLLAGHDTTALTLTYALYLLSKHPDAERRLHEEVDSVVDGAAPTAADVREFTFVDRVLREAMRRYPPVWVMFRQPQVDVELGGYRLPAGTTVMLSQWATHRDGRWYDDPDAFDPDRWAPERRRERPSFAYFPFGGGPRSCIGRQFSLLEAKLILGTIASRYRLEYARDGPFDLRGTLTMHPNDPVEMRVVPR